MGPQVQPKCFRHLKHMRNNWELRKRGYLIRFGHTEALLLKKKRTLNGHFSRPAETDPYVALKTPVSSHKCTSATSYAVLPWSGTTQFTSTDNKQMWQPCTFNNNSWSLWSALPRRTWSSITRPDPIPEVELEKCETREIIIVLFFPVVLGILR